MISCEITFHNYETFPKRPLLPPATCGMSGSTFCTKWSFSAILKILNVWMPSPDGGTYSLNLNPAAGSIFLKNLASCSVSDENVWILWTFSLNELKLNILVTTMWYICQLKRMFLYNKKWFGVKGLKVRLTVTTKCHNISNNVVLLSWHLYALWTIF